MYLFVNDLDKYAIFLSRDKKIGVLVEILQLSAVYCLQECGFRGNMTTKNNGVGND